jgi:hypothetical protein
MERDWGGLHAEKAFDDEAAADGVKEGGVERGAESARDVGGEETSLRLEMGDGTVGLMEKAVMGGGWVRGMCKVSGSW